MGVVGDGMTARRPRSCDMDLSGRCIIFQTAHFKVSPRISFSVLNLWTSKEFWGKLCISIVDSFKTNFASVRAHIPSDHFITSIPKHSPLRGFCIG